MTGNESISRIKLSGGPEQTVSSIYFDARDAAVFEFFDFSPAAQEHFGNDIAIEISGEWQAKQNIAGEIDPNSGGNVVFLSPGFRLTSNAWSGFVSIGLPVINDLNGVQSEPEYQLLSGLTAAF